MRSLLSAACLPSLLLIVSFQSASAQDRRPLSHNDVNNWNHITNRAISDDGTWAMWQQGPEEGDGQLHVRQTNGTLHHVIERGEKATFTGDRRFVVYMIKARFDSTRQAKIDDKPKDEMPADSVAYLDLASGKVSTLDAAVSLRTSEDDRSWFAFRLTKEASKVDTVAADSAASEEVPADTSDTKTPDKPKTSTLVILDPATGWTSRVPDVDEYALSADGQWVAYSRSSEEGDVDGVYLMRNGDDSASDVLTGEGRYGGLVFDDENNQLAFKSDRDAWPAEHPETDIYLKTLDDGAARKVVSARDDAFPDGWRVSEHGAIRFSESGGRLIFGTAPAPQNVEEMEMPDDEKVKLDIWSWTDARLQPQQLVNLEADKKRAFDAILHIASGKIVQLADPEVPQISYLKDGDGNVALAESDVPYLPRVSWDSPRYQDAYLVDLRTGARRQVFRDRQVNTSLSPGGKYVYWWDGHEKDWFAWDTRTGVEVNLTGGLVVQWDHHLADRPMIPGPEGSAGWSEDDALFIIYDKHDIWAIPPGSPGSARMITEGKGREGNLRFRIVDTDRDEPVVPDDVIVSAFDYGTKEQALYRDNLTGDGDPVRLIGGEASFGNYVKAEDADQFLFSRESFTEYPDVWTVDASFGNPRRLSDANPQQGDFLWGTAELVQWTSLDGQELDGILYKPEGFDETKEYPMMVYFYEKLSTTLYSHYAPRASRSSIDRSFYVSRGYLLFVPDIPYKDGYPGESAMNAVMPGVTSLIERGFVDRERIGVQGHSWGGYQIAYMVTQTNLFAAAEAGAPVSNMTSAYGGIRWASGLSRMFQYEKTQSRIGGTLWNAQHRYIDNSPLFQADKVQTPLLMMHNDEDGAVPWYQGIELFVALRRLQKPVWLLNYNGEAHGLRKLHNKRDWSIRMQQFFDHYLMDAPAPIWLQEGVPAVKKGETLGLEYVGTWR